MDNVPEFDPDQAVALLLPVMLHELGSASLAVDAVVELVLHGADDRVTTIDFTTIPVTFAEGPSEDAEVSLVINRAALASLLAGRLDLEAALDAGDVQAVGDAEVLARLARLFEGLVTKSLLQVRLDLGNAGGRS